MDRNRKFTALVTGFGPFGDHKINASWEAVKELEHLCENSEELQDVKLIVKEIPVSYDVVSKCVPQLWEEHKPTVVLHVGVSWKAQCLMVESRAHSSGYERLDVCNKQPNETETICRVLYSNVDVKKICDAVNTNSESTGCKACVSYDAGRYLCEYIFYNSLNIMSANTLFVHIPDFHNYSTTKSAQGLYNILCCMIEIAKHQQ